MVTVIGGVNMDVKGLPFAPLIRGTSNPGRIAMSPGGVARNIAHVVALAGGSAALAGVVGDDPWGHSILERTAGAGVDVSHVKICQGKATDIYIALLSPDGDMDTALSGMERILDADASYIGSLGELFSRSRYIVMDGNLERKSIECVAEIAGKCKTGLIAEPVSVAKAPRFRGLSRMVDIITPNLDELAALTGSSCPDVEGACRSLSDRFRHIVVTLGEKGVYHFESSAEEGRGAGRLYPSFETVPRDATGAGDAFTGGLACGLDAGLSMEESIRFGIACAIITLESVETVSGEISPSAIRALLKNRRAST